MAHNLEHRLDRTSFVSTRRGGEPWHGLGQRVEAMDLQTAFKEGGLDFKVAKAPALMADPITGETVVVPDKYVVYRTDGIPAQPLGVVRTE